MKNFNFIAVVAAILIVGCSDEQPRTIVIGQDLDAITDESIDVDEMSADVDIAIESDLMQDDALENDLTQDDITDESGDTAVDVDTFVNTAVCGNGVVEQGEVCDTASPITCKDISLAKFASKTPLTCKSDCTKILDESKCNSLGLYDGLYKFEHEGCIWQVYNENVFRCISLFDGKITQAASHTKDEGMRDAWYHPNGYGVVQAKGGYYYGYDLISQFSEPNYTNFDDLKEALFIRKAERYETFYGFDDSKHVSEYINRLDKHLMSTDVNVPCDQLVKADKQAIFCKQPVMFEITSKLLDDNGYVVVSFMSYTKANKSDAVMGYSKLNFEMNKIVYTNVYESMKYTDEHDNLLSRVFVEYNYRSQRIFVFDIYASESLKTSKVHWFDINYNGE